MNGTTTSTTSSRISKSLKSTRKDIYNNKRIKRKLVRYVIIGDVLYKISFEGTWLRCLSEEEIRKLMVQVHADQSGCHFNGKVIFHKLLRLGYYWTSMEMNCAIHINNYEKYQKHASIRLTPSQELSTMISPWSFSIWALIYLE